MTRISCAKKKIFFYRGLHPSQYPLYNPAAAAAMSQLERERLGIPPHHVGLDPNDPMVSALTTNPIKLIPFTATNGSNFLLINFLPYNQLPPPHTYIATT